MKKPKTVQEVKNRIINAELSKMAKAIRRFSNTCKTNGYPIRGVTFKTFDADSVCDKIRVTYIRK